MRRILLAAAFASIALSQNTGSITGTVRAAAAENPPVPNAPVTAKNSSSGASFTVRSGADGWYTLSGLAPGSYDIAAEFPPLFVPFSRKGVQVQSGQTVRLDIRLDDVLLNTLGDSGADFLKLMTPQPAPSGPTPRTREGKPDLTGTWLGAMSANTRKPEPLPWAEAVARQRQKDDTQPPSAFCLPMGITFAGFFGPTKMIQTPELLIILDEDEPVRQIYLDGRSHPKDPNPTFMGHSIGKWEGDTLVVDTVGLNDQTWLGFDSIPHTEMLRLIERYRRADLGHLEVEITVDDPGSYKGPWTMKRVNSLAPKDADVMEYICEQNEKDRAHTPVK
jgi:hypothetical protein